MKKYLKESKITGSFVRFIGARIRNAREKKIVNGIYRKNKKILQENIVLREAHREKRCFILATGPSINKQDLLSLKGETVITVSNFFVHPDFKEIKPEFHIFPPSHRPIKIEQFVEWFIDAEKHFPDGQKVLVSVTDRPAVEKFDLFKRQKIYYYLLGNKKIKKVRGSIDFLRPLPSIATVPQLAIYLAWYIGCKEIYLLGCDHNWSTIPGQNGHFYEEKEHAMIRAGYNHKTVQTSMQSRFKAYYDVWETYKEIKQYSDAHNSAIWNSTPGSMLDIFPRKELKDAINKEYL